MNKLLVLGGYSGVGAAIVESATNDGWEVVVSNRADFDLLNAASVTQFASTLSNLKPDAIVLNAYSRTIGNVEKAFAQVRAAEQLWETALGLDTCFIVVSSTATYKPWPVTDAAYALYIDSKKALNAFCISKGWRNLNNPTRKARMVLFEPSMMFNRVEKAELQGSTVISKQQLWDTLKAAISLRYSFLRIGGQG
jgi:hypothetical protein